MEYLILTLSYFNQNQHQQTMNKSHYQMEEHRTHDSPLIVDALLLAGLWYMTMDLQYTIAVPWARFLNKDKTALS